MKTLSSLLAAAAVLAMTVAAFAKPFTGIINDPNTNDTSYVGYAVNVDGGSNPSWQTNGVNSLGSTPFTLTNLALGTHTMSVSLLQKLSGVSTTNAVGTSNPLTVVLTNLILQLTITVPAQ